MPDMRTDIRRQFIRIRPEKIITFFWFQIFYFSFPFFRLEEKINAISRIVVFPARSDMNKSKIFFFQIYADFLFGLANCAFHWHFALLDMPGRRLVSAVHISFIQPASWKYLLLLVKKHIRR